MEDIEHRALATFHIPPRFWRRYMDDTCTALPHDLVDPFHEHLNSLELHIQFTVERESGGQLPFLDVLLTREEGGTMSTEVHRKPMHTDQYLAFDSHHPAAHKRPVVRTLMCQAETLSSSGVNHVQKEKHIQDSLWTNGYPAVFITKHTLPQQGQRSEE